MERSSTSITGYSCNRRTYCPQDRNLRQQLQGLHYDHLGSLLALTNTDGDVLKRVTYDSFGNIIKDTKTSFNVLGFAGGLYDADTGLIRFGYRDYDPETGRWTSKDPIGFDGGDANLYAYCGGDPVNWVDELGLFDMIGSYQAFHNGAQPIDALKKYHYNRNQFNQTVSYDIASTDWNSNVSAYYHQMGEGAENYRKFVSPDGHSELVFTPCGELVTDPINMGTYNFSDPSGDPIQHFINDMLPYYVWGNTPNDPTNIFERMTGTYGGIMQAINRLAL